VLNLIGLSILINLFRHIMKKILNFIILGCFLTGFATFNSCSENEKDNYFFEIVPEGRPTVTISINPITITATSVIAEGNVTSEGNAFVIQRGFKITSPTMTSRPIICSSSGTGKFTQEITGLWPGTKYRISAYAKNSVGTAYSTDVGFTTPIPEVTTYLVTVVSQTGATVVGRVTNINGLDIVEKGICYATTPTPTTEGLHCILANFDETFTCNLKNLIPGTKYYARAYVSGKWSEVGFWIGLTSYYGNEISFTTGDDGSIP
jgi:hypothetical protein